ncbi:autotransporter outer membrane beta-barrel domain-containing protein [Flavobacterium aurantiibacter]|uniref:Uncharacterized protein n=1 Tax=Flavobacterium aurantiibacter TaxID=2023067 RepID=A0A256A7D0_9FLAO|nr:hypothetical protein [Flavobacterium aurantiibacter]OYQ49656.1 hypothetical protein CHX27_01315 [Flavobacterium aurantiibacter]
MVVFANAITGTNPNTANPYTTGQIVNSNITVSGIGRSGVTGSNANDRYNASGWDSASINTARYYEFIINPNSGYEIDFSSFVYTGQASGSGPTSVVIRSSADNYTNNVGVPTVSGTTINLSATAYQNITTPIRFRVYAFGASSPGGTFSINSFTFNGNVNLSTVPALTTNPSAVTGLDFFVDAGPSVSKPINVIGANLVPSIGTISITATTNFEVSSDNLNFGENAIIDYDAGTITSIPIYVRTVSGLSLGTYNGSIVINGGTAPDVTVNVQGIVRASFTIPYENNFRTQAAVDDAVAQGFVINNAVFNATGYKQISLNGFVETPTIDFTAYSSIQVGFDAATFGGVAGQTLELQISEDNGLTYTSIGSVVPTSATFAPSRTDVNLTNYPSTTGKFRVRMTAGGNTSRFRDFYVLETTLWDGTTWSNGAPDSKTIATIDGDYATSINGSINAKRMEVVSGAVQVNSGTTINLEDEINVASGSVNFENNAHLIQLNAAINKGEISVSRNAMMRRLDYVYWSSPVASQLLNDFSPLTLPNRFYTLDEATNEFQSVDPTVTNFSVGRGFMVRAPNNYPTTPQNFTGVFTGTPHNGTITVPITRTGLGYNLVGNPYPSPISATAFAALNPTIGTLYFWTHTTQGVGVSNYATFNATGAAASAGGEIPNGIIQVGQGFLINAPLNATSVTFNNLLRVNNFDDQFFRSTPIIADSARFWLNLNHEEDVVNQILIGYIPGATDAIDVMYDGKMFENTASSIYGILEDSAYSIVGKAFPFEYSDVVPLGFRAGQPGSYTLELKQFDGLFASGDSPIYLKDQLTGAVIDLKESVYNFTAEQGVFESRFEIVYENSLLAANNLYRSKDVQLFGKNGKLHIQSNHARIVSLKLFDMMGRMLLEDVSSPAQNWLLDISNVEEQVVIVRVELENSVVVINKFKL